MVLSLRGYDVGGTEPCACLHRRTLVADSLGLSQRDGETGSESLGCGIAFRIPPQAYHKLVRLHLTPLSHDMGKPVSVDEDLVDSEMDTPFISSHSFFSDRLIAGVYARGNFGTPQSFGNTLLVYFYSIFYFWRPIAMLVTSPFDLFGVMRRLRGPELGNPSFSFGWSLR